MDGKELLSFLVTNRHVQAVLAVVLSFAAAMLAQWILVRLVSPFLSRTTTDLDDEIIKRLQSPIFNTVLLVGLGAALAIAQPPPTIAVIALAIIKSLVTLVWLAFGLWLSRIILTWMTQQQRYKMVQPVTRPLFEIVAKLVLFGAATYSILISWRVDVTGWMASAGIIGIAVGFAAKDTLSNLFAGVSILADTPYKVGDMIMLDSGERGRVTHIGLRSTRIETRDEIEVTIPNSIIANARIKNESRPQGRERIKVSFELSYGIDADQVKGILLDAARSDEHVLDVPEPWARLARVTDRGITFDLLCWIDDPVRRGRTYDAINSAVYRKLLEAGIDALPTKHELFVRESPKQPGDERSPVARESFR